MNPYFVYAIGFLAQILFSARLLVQWISSEKAGRVLSPLLFWQLSILASFLLVLYGVLRHDLAILLGQAVTYGIYIRNLSYHGFWKKIPRPARIFIVAFPIMAICWLISGETYHLQKIIGNKDISFALMVWGLTGQIVFTFRFVLQWFYSEKKKQSILPIEFWIFSILGSIMVLSYAIIRRDPVLFIGQLFGFVVYFRNTLLWWRQRTHLNT
ncbi:MAG: lipid-A-disaccharide synthase N-terminal domain-containing protein [Proteobacteria bacterium]|nr:lipid-A-disaccharide synthase N-terminal domain-containing protein [Pseudomonadota bacterium]